MDVAAMLCGSAAPASGRFSPEPTAPLAPRAAPAADAPVSRQYSDMSDTQLLAIADTASLTADQLDRRHHLLRHSLPDDARGESVLVHFEVGSVHEAVKLIKKMSQRDLQAKFKLVYGAKTFSNNNNWLRRKLFEAIGVDPAKGAVKKAAAGAGGRRRRGAGVAKPRGGSRAAKPRGAAARGRWGYDAADEDWELYPGAGAHIQAQFQEQYAGTAQYQYQQYQYQDEAAAEEEVDAEDASHACEALLALSAAAESVEDGFSEGGAPSDSAPEEPSPASPTTLDHAEAALQQEAAVEAAAAAAAHGAGSAAFRRLLLQQHEAAHAQAQAQAAAAAGVAEWIAAVHQHAVAAGNAEEAAALAAQMQAVAAAHLRHPLLGMLGHASASWPGYGMPMLPPAPAMLGHLMAPQQAAPPLFAAAK